MTDPKELRAGDSDRATLVAALRAAHADGRLSDAELADRVAAAEAARTFGDLDGLVVDLPIAPPSREFAAGRFGTAAAPAPLEPQRWPSGVPVDRSEIGRSPESPLVIDPGWSSDNREGDWEVPQFLQVRGGVGNVRLDFTEAIAEHNVINIWVDGDLGSITIIVPEGWAADADGLRKAMGSVRVEVPREPTMGRPLLVVSGSMGMGSFTVRPPNWFERRRLEKRLR